MFFFPSQESFYRAQPVTASVCFVLCAAGRRLNSVPRENMEFDWRFPSGIQRHLGVSKKTQRDSYHAPCHTLCHAELGTMKHPVLPGKSQWWQAVSFTNELFLIASGDTLSSAVGWSTLEMLDGQLEDGPQKHVDRL